MEQYMQMFDWLLQCIVLYALYALNACVRECESSARACDDIDVIFICWFVTRFLYRGIDVCDDV